MSLKEAVSALRSLKAELEASRSSKADLVIAYRGVVEELRVAKEANQQQRKNIDSGVSNAEDGRLGGEKGQRRLDDECGENDDAPSHGGNSAVEEENEAWRAALEEEARSLREELALVNARAEETADMNQELQESRESVRAAAEAAEGELAKEKARAEAAEREVTKAAEEANQLRMRLDETASELERARDALAAGERRREEGEEVAGSCDDDEDAADLESELKSIRDAIAGPTPNPPGPAEGQVAVRSAASVAALEDAVASAVERANQLQEELESTARDNLEVRELLEGARQKEKEQSRHRMAQEGEAKATVAAMTSKLAESAKEMEGLRECLARVEQDKTTSNENASALKAALKAVREEVASLGASLVRTTGTLEEAQQVASSREEESSSLRRELDAAREELGSVTAMASAAAASAEEAEAVRRTKATAALERERAATAEALSRIAELETTLRETEVCRNSLLVASASEAETRERLAANVAKELEEREAAKEEARKAEERASTAEAKVSRLKSRVAALKDSLSEAEKTSKVALVEEVEARLGVEETLLMANKELQRLEVKKEEALSESKGLRRECERLSATVETLRAAAVAALGDNGNTAAHSTIVTQAGKTEEGEKAEEIAHLRKVIEEMERARDEVGTRGGSTRGVLSDDGRYSDDGGLDEEGVGEGGGQDKGGGAEARRQIIAERDSLRAELARERQRAAERTAGLETQLADKEREAADTQRRLYLRQNQLETELEDLSAHHDSLRVEIARMDASIQNVSDASLPASFSTLSNPLSSKGSGGSRAMDGSASARKSTGRDPAAIGAEVGGAVGGILRGKFWSGWRGGGAASAETNEGGRMGEAGSGAGPVVAASRGSKARRGDRHGGIGQADQQSISRVRESMMARLQEAAREGQGKQKESNGGADGVKNKSIGDATADNGDDKEKESDVLGGSDGGEPAAVGSLEDEWVEETVEHPPPDYGLDSPVIRYLLQQWSADPEKLKYLSLWLRCVIERRKVPDAFPSGLQLVGLAPEIKDGFLTLVIPMIRFTGGMPVLVHSRRSPPEESPPGGGGMPGSTSSTSSRETVLWDLRVKAYRLKISWGRDSVVKLGKVIEEMPRYSPPTEDDEKPRRGMQGEQPRAAGEDGHAFDGLQLTREYRAPAAAVYDALGLMMMVVEEA